MRLLILPCAIFLAACDGAQPETVFIRPDIPAETLTECPISDRVAETYRDLAILATEHLDTARCANGKLGAVREILAGAE